MGRSLSAQLIEEHEAIIVAMERRDHRTAAAPMHRHVRESVKGHIEGFTGESDLGLANAMHNYQQFLDDLNSGATAASMRPA